MNSPGSNAVGSIELDERQARIDLAAAFRLAGRMDMVEGVGNHFSYLLPGEPPRFLINARGQHFSEMSAGHFLTASLDGAVLAGQGELRPVAFFIHSRIHLARPEARCVLHAHPPYATALTMVEGGRIVGAHQLILRLGNRIAYDDDYNGVALDEAEGDRIAAAMGDDGLSRRDGDRPDGGGCLRPALFPRTDVPLRGFRPLHRVTLARHRGGIAGQRRPSARPSAL